MLDDTNAPLRDNVREHPRKRSNIELNSSSMFCENFTPPDPLVEGIIMRGFIYALTAPTGRGKTAVALHIGIGLVGRPFVERTVPSLDEVQSFGVGEQIHVLDGGNTSLWRRFAHGRLAVPEHYREQQRCCHRTRRRHEGEGTPSGSAPGTGCLHCRLACLIETRARASIDTRHALLEHRSRVALKFGRRSHQAHT